jgi:hypothetical protein
MRLEMRQTHIAESGFQHPALDARHLDDRAFEDDLEGLLVAPAQDAEPDLGAGLAAHQLHRLVQTQTLHRLVVDADDHVAGLESGALGRRVVDRRDHLDETVLHADLDAESAELAAGADLEVAVLLAVDIGRMRVESRQHAADGILDQGLVLDLLDIVLLDASEDIGEGSQRVERQILGRFSGRSGLDRGRLLGAGDGSDQKTKTQRKDELKKAHHHESLADGG